MACEVVGMKGENWKGCWFIEVCCDYGVCGNQMMEDLGETCETQRCANWIFDHLIDMQEDDEFCDGCVWNR